MDIVSAIKTHPPYRAGSYIDLRAFNLTPGATFFATHRADDTPFSVWVIMQISRHPDNEMVWAWARRADLITEGPGDNVQTQTFMLDYCDTVHIVGHCVNPHDPDDNDWGN